MANVFFSALLLVLGHIFFFMFCPGLIRDHSSLSQFRNEGKGAKQLYEYARAIGMNWESIRIEADVIDTDSTEPEERRFQRIFWVAYQRADRYGPPARIISALFYAAGMILIAWVVWENTAVVVNFILKT